MQVLHVSTPEPMHSLPGILTTPIQSNLQTVLHSGTADGSPNNTTVTVAHEYWAAGRLILILQPPVQPLQPTDTTVALTARRNAHMLGDSPRAVFYLGGSAR